MAIVTTDNQHYMDIAAAIRAKNGTDTQYTPAEMAAAIQKIQTDGEGMAFVAQTASTDWDSTQEVSLSIATAPKALVLAVVMHRYSIETPDGWNLLFCGADMKEDGYDFTQQVSVFTKVSDSYSESFYAETSSFGRASIIMFTILNNSENLAISDVKYGQISDTEYIYIQKENPCLNLHILHRIMAGINENHIEANPDFIQVENVDRVGAIIDCGPIIKYKIASEIVTIEREIAYFSIIIPKAEEEIDYDFSGFESNAVNTYEAAKAVNILLGRE